MATTTYSRPVPYEFPPNWNATYALFPRLRQPLLQFIFETLVWIGAFYLTMFQLPFRIALWLAPRGLIEDVVYNVSHTVYEWTLPLVNLIENTTYSALQLVDTAMDRGVQAAIQTHQGNMNHFKVALEAYLRLIEEKSDLIQRHGLKGVQMMFTQTHTAKAA